MESYCERQEDYSVIKHYAAGINRIAVYNIGTKNQ